MLLSTFMLIGFVPLMVQGDESVGSHYENALRSSQAEKLTEAIIYLKNALQIDADHLPSRLLMAEVLIAQGNGSAAEAELEYAQSHGVTSKRLLPLLAEAYILQDKYRQVLDVAKAASRGSNIESQLAYFRGRAHLGLRQLSSAFREFEKALQLKPGHNEAKLGKAQVLILRDQVGQASILVDQILKQRSVSANVWLVQANIQRLKGDLRGSFTSLNRAITVEPAHLAARLARAGILISRNELDNAEKDIDFILVLIPLEPRAKYLKAIVSASRGDAQSSDDKIQEVVTTLKAVPDDVMRTNPSYLYLAGVTSFELKSYDVAKAFLNRYLKVVPNDFDSIRLLAVIELRTGRPSIARTLLARANVVYPNNPNILSLLGLTYMDLRNFELAQDYFEQVVVLAPGAEVGLINLARSKVASGQIESAISDLLKAKSAPQTQIELDLLLAEAYIKSNQYKKAIEIYRQLMETSPKNAHFVQLYGIALGLSGDRASARGAFNRALDLDPANTAAMIHLSRMDLMSGNREQAVKYLEAKLAEYPDNYELMVELGRTFSLLGESQSALLWFNKAFVQRNDIHETLDGLVNEYVRAKKHDDAVKVLDEFIGRNPSDAKAHTMLGRVYEQLNEPHKAIKAFTAATNFATTKGKALMNLAQALSSVDDREGAINALRKAVAWDESYLAGYIMLTKLVIADGDKAYALKLIEKIEKLSKDTPVALILKGEMYGSFKAYREAELAYIQALEMGDSRQALLGLYRIYKSQSKEAEAIGRLTAWLKKYPQDLPAGLALADSYFSSGQLDGSKKTYVKLRAIYPDSPIVFNDASEVYFVTGEQKVALEYAKKALDGAPQNANFMDTLGWIESRLGNHKVALSLFRDALAYDFSNLNVKYHLALTLDKLDRRREAVKLLAEVVDSDQVFLEKAEAMSLLDKWEVK